MKTVHRLCSEAGRGYKEDVGVSECPASPEKEDQRAAGRPAALTQLALCLRLASNLRPKADNAPSTLNDSTRQGRLCEVQVWRIQPLYCVRVIIVRLNMRSKPKSFVQN